MQFAECGNPICNRALRFYDKNFAISYREGVLADRMNLFKFYGAAGWGLIFARVLLGFLDDHIIELWATILLWRIRRMSRE